MVGHASYLLLVISMMMRSMTWLRLLAIAFTAIAYDAIWLKYPLVVFWETLLVTVNIIQIALEWLKEHRARFSEEEGSFVRSRLSGLLRSDARRLLNKGVWAGAIPGVILTTQGTPVDNVVYLVKRQVDILVGVQIVGCCRPGNFVGEMPVLRHTPASATAIVATPSRYWLILSVQLRDLQKSEPDMASAFQTGITRDLRNKTSPGTQRRAQRVRLAAVR